MSVNSSLQVLAQKSQTFPTWKKSNRMYGLMVGTENDIYVIYL